MLASLRWLRDNIGLPERALERWTGMDAYELLAQEAKSIAPGSDGLIFLPYLQGERTPHLDAYARSGWIGLTASHDRRHLIRSVLEGVALSLKDCLGILREQGLQREQMRAVGGAKSPLWREIIKRARLLTTHFNISPTEMNTPRYHLHSNC